MHGKIARIKLSDENALLQNYFFLKPPSKAPTGGFAGTMPTFLSSGFAALSDDEVVTLGS